MEKEVKTVQFIEFIYAGSSRIERVEDRKPLRVENFDGKVGFRYFDTYEVDLDDETLSGALRRNKSGMYYFGKRQKNAEGQEVIVCDCGVEITEIEKEDITIQEILDAERKEKDKELFIDRKSFFKGIARVLSSFERKEFQFAYNISSRAQTLNYSHKFSGHSESRYYINLGETPVVTDTRIGKYEDEMGAIDCTDKAMNISFAEAVELVEPLYEDYPYLKDIIDGMRVETLLAGFLSERTILEVGRKYAIDRLEDTLKNEVAKDLIDAQKRISLEQNNPQ